MSDSFHFNITTPERRVFSDTLISLTVPTTEGEITILPGHISLVSTLVPGVITLVKHDGTEDVMAVSGGFIHVNVNGVVILADTAERAEEIDEARLIQARADAEEAKKRVISADQEQFADIASRLAREFARSKAIRRWRDIKRSDL
ncbi:MAG: ATP synthase F1 subunit epsilon [Candidatus Yonathbacteria bacterium]|nr:ATP synthase F1 subunit epsilon [Candidatus Yonathbacteria bacterium]